jgi:hypothetical protein
MRKRKSFDAVKMMRRIRDQISREIKGMTPEQEIAYFQCRAEGGSAHGRRTAGATLLAARSRKPRFDVVHGSK